MCVFGILGQAARAGVAAARAPRLPGSASCQAAHPGRYRHSAGPASPATACPWAAERTRRVCSTQVIQSHISRAGSRRRPSPSSSCCGMYCSLWCTSEHTPVCRRYSLVRSISTARGRCEVVVVVVVGPVRRHWDRPLTTMAGSPEVPPHVLAWQARRARRITHWTTQRCVRERAAGVPARLRPSTHPRPHR